MSTVGTDQNAGWFTGPYTGRTVLKLVLGFFGLIFVPNGFFVYFALTSWPGLVSDNAYQEGLKYNQQLSQAEAQRQTGWRSRVEFGAQKIVRVRLQNAAGQPLIGLAVTLRMRRPTYEGADVVITLADRKNGNYESRRPLEGIGRWRAEVRAVAPDGVKFRQIHRLDVRP